MFSYQTQVTRLEVDKFDIMIPQINGLGLLPKLKEKLPSIKVIMRTTYSTPDTVIHAHHNGKTNYIMKPFSSLKEIEKKIDTLL